MDAAVCAFDPDRHGISDGLSDRAVSVQKEEDVKRQRLIFFLFLLVGMGFLNYPFVSQWVNQRNQSKVIYEYEKKAEKLSDTGKQKLLGEARNYNSKLRAGRVLPGDSFGGGAEETSAYREYQKLLDVFGDGILCYLEIPSIEVFLPVFHGTSEHVLEQGAGHLFGSSLPVGGAGTHAVIAAHTGIATRMFFTDLDQMKTGDLFFLNVLGEKLAYQVDQIVTVTPDRTDLLRIEEGKDQVTLVTCTPYGINSHRLLVRGKRIPYREAQKRAEQAKESGFLIWGKRVFVLSILFLGAAGFWLLKPSKRKEEKG